MGCFNIFERSSDHYSSPRQQMHAGVWEAAAGQWPVTYTEHEYCEIVQGVSVSLLERYRKIYVVFEQTR